MSAPSACWATPPRRDRPHHAGRLLRPAGSDPARTRTEPGVRHHHRTRLRSAGVQGLARHRGHLRADLPAQGRQPPAGGGVGDGAARCAGRDHRLPADRHRQHGAQAGRGRAGAAGPAPARPAVLHTLADRIDRRCADHDRPVGPDLRRQRADRGAHRPHARRADRHALQALLHRPAERAGLHRPRAQREAGHQLRADGPRRRTSARPWCPATRHPSTTATARCAA